MFGFLDKNLTLIEAARSGDVAKCTKMIKKGADVNALDKDGHSPLMLATQTHRPAIMELLLKSGASANFKLPDGKTPLMIAAENGAWARRGFLLTQAPG